MKKTLNRRALCKVDQHSVQALMDIIQSRAVQIFTIISFERVTVQQLC